MFNQFIKKSIHKSQLCNRNWDLSKSIPQEDIDLIVESATQCPVKQNLNYYKTHVITNRDKIEKIHENTSGFYIDGVCYTNTQTLANLVIAFTKDTPTFNRCWHREFNKETNKWDETEVDVDRDKKATDEDRLMAIGVAVGYVALVSTMLGYDTGCCRCFEEGPIHKIIGDQHGWPLLLIGIGYPDITRHRREHHIDNKIIFPTFKNCRETIIHA